MHAEVMDFVKSALPAPDVLRGLDVLEVGSYDCHEQSREFGTIRESFRSASYVGLDQRMGPNVDVQAIAHEWLEARQGQFDLVICCELLDHDPYWKQTLSSMIGALRQRGKLIVTCASPARPVHDVEVSPTPGYYRGLTQQEIEGELMAFYPGLVPGPIRLERGGEDIYFTAVMGPL